MTTIKDVARHAGVSTMTVSRVVNNSGYASEETRVRVEQAIAELGYVPNAVGRQLRSKRTRTVALVVSDITNPFFTTIARAVEDFVAARDFAVMFCSTDESAAAEYEYLQMLVERQIDGVLLVPSGSSPEPFRLLRRHNVPVVVLDRRVSCATVDEVRSDSEAGAYQLVRHLLELGHRRIAMLSGQRSIATAADRVAGYERALGEAGIEIDPELVCDGAFAVEAGDAMARQVLATSPRPTAIFAGNNFIAFGAIRAIRDIGLRVPDDVSVVCFDDVPDEWVIDPFMTCIAQDPYAMGRQAAELLLARLAGKRPAKRRSIILPVQFRVRRSSAPPAAIPGSPAPAPGGDSAQVPATAS
jgi:LacI family transcriptional regulator